MNSCSIATTTTVTASSPVLQKLTALKTFPIVGGDFSLESVKLTLYTKLLSTLFLRPRWWCVLLDVSSPGKLSVYALE